MKKTLTPEERIKVAKIVFDKKADAWLHKCLALIKKGEDIVNAKDEYDELMEAKKVLNERHAEYGLSDTAGEDDRALYEIEKQIAFARQKFYEKLSFFWRDKAEELDEKKMEVLRKNREKFFQEIRDAGKGQDR